MAAGVGITPIRALLADTPFAPGDATLIFRYSDEEHAIFRDELEEIAQRRGADLQFLPGPRAVDGSWQPEGSDTDDARALARLVPDVADRDIYLCGPVPWIAAVRRALRRNRVKRTQIHTEDFAW
jgi:ferredoxin-NADP reductase